MAKSRWSAAPLFPGGPFDWTGVAGRRSRQLLRNIEHTAAVHAFLAHMTRQAAHVGWEVAQLDPPKRASRHFRHQGGRRSVNPDAFGVLRRAGTAWPFFLEWERRAVRPTTMSERLAPYLRYYSSHRPTDDHGARPAVLVVFDDDIAHTHFLRVAQEETDRTRVDIPLWVSHRAAIEELGPLGRAWRSPGHWESPQACRSNDQRPTEGSGAEPSSPPHREKEQPCVRKTPTTRRKAPGGVVDGTSSGSTRRPLAAAHAAGPLPELLAREIGISPSYMSMLVNGERSPSGRIRRRMQKALKVDRFHQLFTLEVTDERQ